MAKDKDTGKQQPSKPSTGSRDIRKIREGFAQDSIDKRPGGGDQTRSKNESNKDK
jgi:hypothetical protein